MHHCSDMAGVSDVSRVHWQSCRSTCAERQQQQLDSAAAEQQQQQLMSRLKRCNSCCQFSQWCTAVTVHPVMCRGSSSNWSSSWTGMEALVQQQQTILSSSATSHADSILQQVTTAPTRNTVVEVWHSMLSSAVDGPDWQLCYDHKRSHSPFQLATTAPSATHQTLQLADLCEMMAGVAKSEGVDGSSMLLILSDLQDRSGRPGGWR